MKGKVMEEVRDGEGRENEERSGKRMEGMGGVGTE